MESGQQETHKDFRRFVEMMGAGWGSAQQVLDGGSERAMFLRAWKAILDDVDVKAVLAHMLFVPGPIPDHAQGVRLLEIVDHLAGRKSSLDLHQDVVQTTAVVVAVEKTRDAEGLSYRVTYVYPGPDNHQSSVERSFSYDSMHASLAGWDERSLDGYWRAGNRMPCHYLASDSRRHAIAEP